VARISFTGQNIFLEKNMWTKSTATWTGDSFSLPWAWDRGMVMGSPECSCEVALKTRARRTCAKKEEVVAGNLVMGEIGWHIGGVRVAVSRGGEEESALACTGGGQGS
jgi:hypothetical protein